MASRFYFLNKGTTVQYLTDTENIADLGRNETFRLW